ncbi:MAG: hypothetical protein QOJ42_3138, partial [Acidobacteriaceae bacterium]|nr:hypothetical protein [Acidobacteriaceae bacterium]
GWVGDVLPSRHNDIIMSAVDTNLRSCRPVIQLGAPGGEGSLTNKLIARSMKPKSKIKRSRIAYATDLLYLAGLVAPVLEGRGC